MTLARRMVARLVQIANASIDLYRIGHFRTAREAAKFARCNLAKLALNKIQRLNKGYAIYLIFNANIISH